MLRTDSPAGQSRDRAFYRSALRFSLLAAIALALFLLVRFFLLFLAQPEADLISWDQAARAGEAVRLAKTVHFHQVAKFIQHVFSLNWWPPLHHLIMFFSILIFGPSFKAVIIPSFMAYFLSLAAFLFTYRNMSPGADEDRLLEYALLFFSAITSPLLLSSASWAMLEIFGILLTYLAFGLYFAATGNNSSKMMRLCGISGFLLWILKYNYGLFFSAIVFLAELARADQLQLKKLLSRRRLRLLSNPLFYPAYLLSLLCIYIAVTGGGSFQWLGRRVSLSNIYNPAMYLYQYLFLTGLLLAYKNWSKIKSVLRPGQKELLVWGALPVGVFLFFPDKVKAIIMHFEAGQKIKPWNPFDSVFYYLRCVCTEYFLVWPWGVISLMMLGLALVCWRKTPANLRLMLGFSLAGFLLSSLGFGLREGRYIATFVPALWFVTAWSSGLVIKKASSQLKSALALLILISTAIAVGHPPFLIDRALKQPWAPWAHHGVEYRGLIEPVIQEIEGAQKVLILGAFDLGFGPLLSWKLQLAQFENPNFSLDIDPPFGPEGIPESPLEKGMLKDYDRVVLYIVEKGTYERPLREWARALEESGRYHLLRKESSRTPKPSQIFFFARD